MTREEMINEIVDLYFKGVPLEVAIANYKDELLKQLKEGKLNGIKQISINGNENKRQ